MNNYWLDVLKGKKMFEEIDEIALEVCDENGTLKDFLTSLTTEQFQYFMDMQMTEFYSDVDDGRFNIEVITK